MSRSVEQLFLTKSAQALLENSDKSPFLNLSQYQLWDIGGLEGLQLATLLIGDAVAKIAPFQSLDVIFTGYQYSALRLSDGHFRLGLYGELGQYGGLTFAQTITQATEGLRVWAKLGNEKSGNSLDAWGCKIASMPYCAIALPQSTALKIFAHLQSTHRLDELPPNCAIPTHIDGISILIWRHQLLSQSIFELHTSIEDAEAIEVKLINIETYAKTSTQYEDS